VAASPQAFWGMFGACLPDGRAERRTRRCGVAKLLSDVLRSAGAAVDHAAVAAGQNLIGGRHPTTCPSLLTDFFRECCPDRGSASCDTRRCCPESLNRPCVTASSG